MGNHTDQDKPQQSTFIHYVFKMALEEMNTLSDFLMAIKPAKYEVEKDIVASLAFLLHKKIRDLRGLMEKMTRENKFGID